MATEERKAKISQVCSSRQEGILVLEDLHNPHNGMAIFRSCDAFSFQKVYLIFDQEEEYAPKELGNASSSSANKWLDFTCFYSTEDCINSLHNDGYTVFATALNEKSKSLFNTDFTTNKKIALLMGNEARGLSEKAIESADHLIQIPMEGMVQSLNISVTAALCLYEINRQRKRAGTENFLLAEEEQIALKKDLVNR